MIAGPNASGKTTVIKPKYVEGRVKRYLDPDRLLSIAEGDILNPKARREYELNHPARFASLCIKDWLASERIRSEGFATESNLVSKHDFKTFRAAKAAGMQTELYFVGVPLEVAIQREQARVAGGEQKKIEIVYLMQRYSGIFNIQSHIDYGDVDIVMIYDNSHGKGEEQLLLRVEGGKTIFRHPNPPEWFRSAGIKQAAGA